MTPFQLRIARALLEIDRPGLFDLLREAVSVRTIENFEAGMTLRPSTVDKIKAGVVAAGITFDPDGKNVRLDLRKAKRKA